MQAPGQKDRTKPTVAYSTFATQAYKGQTNISYAGTAYIKTTKLPQVAGTWYDRKLPIWNVRPNDTELRTNLRQSFNKPWSFFFSSGSLYLLIEGCRRARLHLITQTHTHHSVGFPWTKDRPVAVTSTCIKHNCHIHTQTHTHHSVGFPWTKDRPVAVTSTCITHNIHNKHPRTRWDSNPRSQEVRLCEVERNYRITLTGSGPPNNTYACIKRI